ncbi:MAG: hypothetical protein M3362_17660 [Acidobacteriota bacterium]|nr:hypothetical protein [Acidobacteriota bacterium]
MKRPADNLVRARAVAIVIFLAVVSFVFVYPRMASTAVEGDTQGRSQQGRRRATQAKKTAPVDYAKFSHRTKEHQKSCSECHKFPSKNWKEVRKGDAAFPDITEFPEHSSCIGCHREQFFARERPAPRICSNCHVAISPRNTVRFHFPSITGFIDNPARGRDPVSDFGINFPHDKHVDIVGFLQPSFRRDDGFSFVNASFGVTNAHHRQQESEPKSCAVCHQTYMPQGKSDDEFVTKRPKGLADEAFWLKKGTFKTIPMNHTVCFTCHTQDAGITPAPTDCNICHKLATPAQNVRTDFDPALLQTMGITDRVILMRWRRRESAGAFRHEMHSDQSCTHCHNIPVMNTMDPKTLKVRVQSCGGEGCHITKAVDDGGILNFEAEQRKTKPGFQCTKCHITYGKEPLPATHINAISEMKKK